LFPSTIKKRKHVIVFSLQKTDGKDGEYEKAGPWRWD